MPLFLDAITTNETYFFRDPQHYDWLGDTFLPEIAGRRLSGNDPRRLRIWSAACSTGEEPYSIALKILAKKPLFAGWKITLAGNRPERRGPGLPPAPAATTPGPSA